MKELILAVKKQKALWDVNASSYKDQAKRIHAWATVAEECGLTIACAKAKWRGIRDTFTKFMNAKNRAAGQERPKRKNYCYAEEMEFMKPILWKFKSRTRKIKEQEPSMDALNDEPVPRTTVDSEHQEGANSLLYECPGPANGCKTETSETPSLKSNVDGQLDAIDLLFLSYSKTIKTFSKRRQIALKRKFAELLSDEELEQLMENELEASSTGTLSRGNQCKTEPN